MRILLSFHYYRDTDLDEMVAGFPERPTVFADSGAFSAMTVGAAIQLEEYAEWLTRWSHIFTTCCTLDVIGDAQATWDNTKALEERGLRPLPVFHGGSGWEWLDRYCAEYGYIALGGLVGSAGTSELMRWCVACFQRARLTGTLFHGFGMTKLPLLRALPWYSIDSSSWGAGHRFGTLSLWDERGRWVRASLGDHASIYKAATLIRAHGGDPVAFATPGYGMAQGKAVEQYRAERRAIIACNVVAWSRLERWLRARHGEVGPPRADTPAGPLVYLADSRGGAAVNGDRSDLALAVRDAGPLIYYAEGVARNLVMAAEALEGESDVRR